MLEEKQISPRSDLLISYAARVHTHRTPDKHIAVSSIIIPLTFALFRLFGERLISRQCMRILRGVVNPTAPGRYRRNSPLRNTQHTRILNAHTHTHTDIHTHTRICVVSRAPIDGVSPPAQAAPCCLHRRDCKAAGGAARSLCTCCNNVRRRLVCAARGARRRLKCTRDYSAVAHTLARRRTRSHHLRAEGRRRRAKPASA